MPSPGRTIGRDSAETMATTRRSQHQASVSKFAPRNLYSTAGTHRPRHRLRTPQRRGSVSSTSPTKEHSAFSFTLRKGGCTRTKKRSIRRRSTCRSTESPDCPEGCGRQAARRTGLVRRAPAPRLGKEPAGKLARRRLPVSRRTAVRGGLPQLLRDGDQHGRRHRAAAGFSAGRRAGRIDSGDLYGRQRLHVGRTRTACARPWCSPRAAPGWPRPWMA